MPGTWLGPLMIEGQPYPLLPDWVMSSGSLLPDSGVMNSLLPDCWVMNKESFSTKAYDMVDDPATDAVVSWRPDGRSFVVWDIPRLMRDLLPKYFNHSGFNAFTLQLLICGFKFRFLNNNQAEFAKVEFFRGKRHLLYPELDLAKVKRRGETDPEVTEEIKKGTEEDIKVEIKQVKEEIKEETKDITKVEIKKVKEEIKEVKDITSSSIQKFKKRRIDGLSACSSSS